MVMGTLTVRENLYFSAALRLPLSVSWDQKKRCIKRIISELGLEDCADTRVKSQHTYILLDHSLSLLSLSLFYLVCIILGWNRVQKGNKRRRKEED